VGLDVVSPDIPIDTLEKGRDLDTLVDKMSQFAKRGAVSKEAEKRAEQGFVKLLDGYTSHEVFLWRENFRVMTRAVVQHRDTIWGFILKNAYRPAYLRRQKVEVIVANPPWLSLRDIKDKAYKLKIKELTFQYKLLGKKERHLFTQIDTSTVFFAHAEREFLRPGGTMAFVMPKSVILPAKQHLAFQKIGFAAIHEFAEVNGLFKVPSCVLIRDAEARVDNIPITNWSGDLTNKRNLSWSAAQVVLKARTETWSFLASFPPRSPYFPHLLQGATLVPRSLWFVELPANQPVNLKTPYARTAKSVKASAKKPWEKIEMKGKVERQFLFATALAEDLLPFAIRKFRLVVLPLLAKDDRFVLVSPEDILAEGAPLASDWMRTADKIWERRKKEDQPTLNEYINYDQKITKQNPAAEFVFLYNRSATNLTAAYITAEESQKVGLLQTQGFIADFVMYRYYPDSEDHALYLVGVLNTPVVNAAIKRWQTQGLKGERDIARRPFEVCPIPLFDSANDLHHKIVEVSRVARLKMLDWKSKIEGNAAQARWAARKVIRPELESLNELVKQLLEKEKAVERVPNNTDDTPNLFKALERVVT
jgi:hypothetical protein